MGTKLNWKTAMMMGGLKRIPFIFFLVALTVLFVSCSNGEKVYKIGVSQCSKGRWRDKVNNEMLAAQHLYEQNVKETGRVFPQVKLEHLKPLPIVLEDKEKQLQIESLVKQIINAKRINPSTDTSALESEIDRLVYQLYRLTDEEIKIIEDGD